MKKTILYIHHGQGIGGAPLSLLHLVCALDAKKYRPVVLFLHHSEAVSLFTERGIEVLGPVERTDFSHTKVWWYRWFHPHHLLRALRDSWALWRGEAAAWIQKVNPDIVHLNTSTLLVWGVVARQLGIPVVWHVREPLAPGYLGLRRWLVTQLVGRYATKILPICRNDARPWKQLKKTEVVYNAVDLDRFQPDLDGAPFRKKYDFEPDAPVILFLGGMSRNRGTHLILQAFTQLLQKMPTARLVIAGRWGVARATRWGVPTPEGRALAEAEKLLKPICHAVRLVGVLSDVPAALAAATVLVSPPLVGHFARPVIEAGCMGVPVVASRLAPMDELVVDGATGFLVPPTDVTGWAEKLHELCSNKAVHSSMSEKGLEFCRRRFGVAPQVRQVERVYEKAST